MPTIEAFFSAARTIVTLGAKTNAASRTEIREVVGDLGDQLERGLSLADAYLGGALVVKDAKELEAYLVGAYSKIMSDFHEYKVCSALYQLADEFKQVFSAKRLSISVAELSQVRELIERLRDGERAVIDSLDSIMQQLAALGNELGLASPRKAAPVRAKIVATVNDGRALIASHRKHIKSLARRITDTM